jgi:hypothetical protein
MRDDITTNWGHERLFKIEGFVNRSQIKVGVTTNEIKDNNARGINLCF